MWSFCIDFAKYWLFPLVANGLLFAAVLGFYYDVPALSPAVNAAYCACVDEIVPAVYEHEKLKAASSLRQTLEYGANAMEAPSEIAGWSVYRPQNPEEPAVMRVSMERSKGEAIFFPRVSGADASVSVAEIRPEGRAKVFEFKGSPKGWTPIGAQYRLPLRCLGENGRILLEITLRGRWSQLWNKDSTIFF